MTKLDESSPTDHAAPSCLATAMSPVCSANDLVTFPQSTYKAPLYHAHNFLSLSAASPIPCSGQEDGHHFHSFFNSFLHIFALPREFLLFSPHLNCTIINKRQLVHEAYRRHSITSTLHPQHTHNVLNDYLLNEHAVSPS